MTPYPKNKDGHTVTILMTKIKGRKKSLHP